MEKKLIKNHWKVTKFVLREIARLKEYVKVLYLWAFRTQIVLLSVCIQLIPLTQTPGNSNLMLTWTKIDFPWISLLHLP